MHKPDLFEGGAIFERLQHFKDYGVPGTVDDPVNQAAIADGTCRVLGYLHNGYHFWKNPTQTKETIKALAALPGTDSPSLFVLTAINDLAETCKVPESESFDNSYGINGTKFSYDFDVVTGSMQNWHRALCAPEDSKAWGGAYDPAYMPQQQTLTVGFMYIVTYDANQEKDLPASDMYPIAFTPQMYVDRLCHRIPFGSVQFDEITSIEELAKATKPLMGKFANE